MTDFERFEKRIKSPCDDLPLPNPRSIRVLRRLEIASALSSFSLSTLDISANASYSYRALSYTWGPPEVRQSEDVLDEFEQDSTVDVAVYVDATKYVLSISRNLDNALNRVAPFRHGSNFWVDALCINQRDDEERNYQVQRMGEIYSKAKEVIAWVGEGHDETEEMIWMHRLFYKRLLSWQRLPQLPSSRDAGPQLNASQMNTIAAFYSMRRFWKRCWIIQELVLAQRATVAYGDVLLYMQSFLTIADFVKLSNSFWGAVRARRDRWTGEHTGNGTELLRINEVMRWLRHARLQSPEFDKMLSTLYGEFDHRHKGHACMAWLLSTTRIFEATDPRDKIYSMIGLLDNFCNDKADFCADYSKTTEDVFYKTTVSLLESLPYLSILSQREDRPRLETSSLPSWVPNFASTNLSTELEYQRAGLTDAENFNVLGTKSPPAPPKQISINENRLRLRGYQICTIRGCGTLITGSTSAQIDYNHQQLETVKFLLHACHEIGPSYGYNTDQEFEDTALACADTVTTGQLGSENPEARARCLSAWISLVIVALGSTWARSVQRPSAEATARELEMLHKTLGRNGTLPYLETDMARVQEEIQARSRTEKRKGKESQTPPKPTLDRSAQLVQHMHKHTAVSKPFLTDKLLLGMGPRSAIPGDQIWLLCGARVPFVLRKVSNTGYWRLVGEAYLHSIMDGELVKAGQLGESQTVTLV